MTKLFGLVLSLAAVGCGDNTPASAPDATPTTDAAPDAPGPPPSPRITFFDYAIAVDVTPDGRTAVFEDLSDGALAVEVDTVTGLAATPIDVGDPARVLVTGISQNRHLSALHGEPVTAGVHDGTAWHDLPSPYATPCGADVGAGWDVSADGTVVVGMMWNGCSPVAFRWVEGAAAVTPLQVLGSVTAIRAPTNRATVVSDDGQVAAGYAENLAVDRSPAIWAADGTGFLIDPAFQDAPGEVLSINADGSRVAGIWANEGFVWSSAGGKQTIPLLATVLGGDPVYPNAMSGDGTLVFGGMGSAFSSIPVAFVWSEAKGSRDLTTLARDAGIAIPADTQLGSVLGASADGTVLVGIATTDINGAGLQKSFVLRLPAASL
ncbi:MAG: hypothetical protein NT062_22090 [Proteobacteria bacterium]|nr:hypothetical protein [Pseudomonadota bacterium]